MVIGGGLAGCEVADYLTEYGNKVSVVEILPGIAMDGDADTQAYFKMKFEKNNVRVLTETKIERFESNTAILICDDENVSVQFDKAVMAVGALPDDELYKKLENNNYEIMKVGDCKAPRRILEAVHEGFEAGREI